MKTVTISTRLTSKEAKEIESFAKMEGLDRSSLLKQLIRYGFSQVRFERACEAYRGGEVTLSRAAELAGVSYRELLARMPEAGLELNFDVEELKRDLKTSRELWP